MAYDMSGVPLSAEYEAAMLSYGQAGGYTDNIPEQVVRLKFDATVRDLNGDYIAELVQKGFSDIAVATGGKVYEY
ncbi:MAG: hypothetical protein IJ446_07535 [Oscillospiraceae bacterium]|nr:hypothetical protein [Oscillospiraceae bacterium]